MRLRALRFAQGCFISVTQKLIGNDDIVVVPAFLIWLQDQFARPSNPDLTAYQFPARQ